MTTFDQTTLLPSLAATSDRDLKGSTGDRWSDPRESDHHRQNKLRALGQLAWMLPALVAAAISLVRPTWANLNAGELALWATADSGRAGLISVLREAETPYAAVIWAWTRVAGTSDLALRFPSIILIAAAAALIGVLGSRMGGAKVGFVAGLLFAVLPAASQHAQNSGPAALTIFAAVLATLCLTRLLDRIRFGGMAAYAAAASLLLLCGVGAAAVLLAHLLAVLVLRRRAIVAWLVAVVIGAVPVVVTHLWLLQSPPRADRLLLEQAVPVIGGTLLLGGVVMGLAAVSFSTRKNELLLSAWALLPPLSALLLSSITGRSVLGTVVTAIPAWVLLAALALKKVPTIRSVVVLLLITAAGLPAQLQLRTPSGHGLAAAELATELTAGAQPGDALVFGADDREALLGRDLIARYVPVSGRPADMLVTRAPRKDGELYAQECPKPQECLAPANRIWLVRVGAPVDALTGFPAAKDGYLRTEFKVQRRWQFEGLTLVLLTRSSMDS